MDSGEPGLAGGFHLVLYSNRLLAIEGSRMWKALSVTLMVATLALCGSCSRPSEPNVEGRFAYLDSSGSPAIYDIAAGANTWAAGEKRACSGPVWSADGHKLAYLTYDGELLLNVLSLLDGNQETWKIDPQGFDLQTYGLAVECSWSPSGKYMALRGPGYPSRTVEVVDVSTGRAVLCADAMGLVWALGQDSLCYGVYRPDSRDMTLDRSDLVIVDLPGSDPRVVIEGAPGHWLVPAYWSRDIGVVYSDSTPNASGASVSPPVFLDTSGRTAKPLETTPPSLPQQTESFKSAVGEILSGANSDPKTGNTLFTAKKDKTTQVWLFLPDTGKLVKLVEGSSPAWQP